MKRMRKFVPYAKLSKKEKRKIDAARRRTWGPLDPVTRRADNPRAYRRERMKKEEKINEWKQEL